MPTPADSNCYWNERPFAHVNTRNFPLRAVFLQFLLTVGSLSLLETNSMHKSSLLMIKWGNINISDFIIQTRWIWKVKFGMIRWQIFEKFNRYSKNSCAKRTQIIKQPNCFQNVFSSLIRWCHCPMTSKWKFKSQIELNIKVTTKSELKPTRYIRCSRRWQKANWGKVLMKKRSWNNANVDLVNDTEKTQRSSDFRVMKTKHREKYLIFSISTGT